MVPNLQQKNYTEKHEGTFVAQKSTEIASIFSSYLYRCSMVSHIANKQNIQAAYEV